MTQASQSDKHNFPPQKTAAHHDCIFEIDRKELALIDKRKEAGFFATGPDVVPLNPLGGGSIKTKPTSPVAEQIEPKTDNPPNRSSEKNRQQELNETKPKTESHNSQYEKPVYGRTKNNQPPKQGPSSILNHRDKDNQEPQKSIKEFHAHRTEGVKKDSKGKDEPSYKHRDPPAHLANKDSYNYKQNEAYPLFDQQYQSLNLDSKITKQPTTSESHFQKHHENPKHAITHHKHQKVDYLHDDGTHDGEPDTKDHPKFKKEFANQKHYFQPDPYLKISSSHKKIELVRPEPLKNKPEIEDSNDQMKQFEMFKQIVASNLHNSNQQTRDSQPQPKPREETNLKQTPNAQKGNHKSSKSSVQKVEEDLDYLLHIPKDVDVANATVFDQKRNIVYMRVDKNESEKNRLKELERKKAEIKMEKEHEEQKKRKEREELLIKQEEEEKKRLEKELKKWEEED